MKRIIDQLGTICFYNDKGNLHRENAPAVECANGNKFWYKNGKLDREDGPAREYVDGEKHWIKNGQYHKEDGPAIEYADGEVKYYYNNILYPEIKTDEEWIKFVKLMVFL